MSDNLSLWGYVKVKGKKESIQLELIQTPTRVTQEAMASEHPEIEYYRYLVDGCDFEARDLLEQFERIQSFKDRHYGVYWLSDQRKKVWK